MKQSAVRNLIIPAVPMIAMTIMGGCGPKASEGGFDSDNPAAKLYAIRDAGERKDTTAVPQLVEQLDNDDPAVRVFAIEALERITGQRMGYNPNVSRHDRAKAVNRWEQAVRDGQFDLTEQEN